MRLTLAKWLFIAAAGISFALSIYLWFTGQREEGMFVGLWVPSILSLGALVFAGRNLGRLAMTPLVIFIVGGIVTTLAITAVILVVGLSEAADPRHSGPDDLAAWERSAVGDQRRKNLGD